MSAAKQKQSLAVDSQPLPFNPKASTGTDGESTHVDGAASAAQARVAGTPSAQPRDMQTNRGVSVAVQNVARALEKLELVQSTRLPKKELEAVKDARHLLKVAMERVREHAPFLLEEQDEPEAEEDAGELVNDSLRKVGYCGVKNPHGRGACTGPKGHAGNHYAHAGPDAPRWPHGSPLTAKEEKALEEAALRGAQLEELAREAGDAPDEDEGEEDGAEDVLDIGPGPAAQRAAKMASAAEEFREHPEGHLLRNAAARMTAQAEYAHDRAAAKALQDAPERPTRDPVAPHTPGPWHVEHHDSHDDGRSRRRAVRVYAAGRVVVATLTHEKDDQEATAAAQADARLIATAPELVALLKEQAAMLNALRLGQEVEQAKLLRLDDRVHRVLAGAGVLS